MDPGNTGEMISCGWLENTCVSLGELGEAAPPICHLSWLETRQTAV